MKFICYQILAFILLTGCVVVKKYNPTQKYSEQQLKSDYTLFRNILEESHPSLYWYAPKDSIDYYFKWGYDQLNDSMPEYKFRLILSYVLAKIHCGHTTVRPSEAATKYAENVRSPAFPLNIKFWSDTAVITSTLNRKDSFINRGEILRSIDGIPMNIIIDSLFRFLSADGYNLSHKYQTLSNPGMFRALYANVYGLKAKMQIEVMDTSGHIKNEIISAYNPLIDTGANKIPLKILSKKERKKILLLYNRNLHIDTVQHIAYMDVSTFVKNNKLRGFFRRSFRQIRKNKINNLVIDLRSNGGGSVVLSNLLTRYIADKPFKIADSLYAVKRKSNYGRYIENYGLNRLFLLFLTHKKQDGNYHFSYYEHKYFHPKSSNHFNGNVYLLTGGNTFSAAVLFAVALKNQSNVKVVGEETGGGAYGNTAWLIPDVTLPITKVRFRLPLFRLVIDNKQLKGHGVFPNIEAFPSVEAIRNNRDYKMDKVRSVLGVANK